VETDALQLPASAREREAPLLHRIKTTGTLVDKLRREPHLKLKTIRDVAGARIVIDGGRWEQDRVAERITEAFADCPKAPDLIDRREKPSHGYRAVHVVVYEDGTPVEIQIRTELQDVWAQITEKLGDMWGRGLRYGLGPDQPDAPADPSGAEPERMTRAYVVELMGQLADTIDKLEARRFKIARMAKPLDELQAEAQALVHKVLGTVTALGEAK
jgi:hypothetical protein